MKKIKKILIANRGEIALRIMKTCRRLGISTVAIYSEVDINSPHVKYADEAFCVGPAPSRQSYLNVDAILDACQKSGADAIHPGFGFLSENSDFVDQVEAKGIIFIGPNTKAMDLMGKKIDSKIAVKKYGVPLVPGMDEPITDVEKAKKIAQEIGFPVLIKASAGGGGKGMRIVENVESFLEQMQLAQSEALNAFSDSSVFIEKYVTAPRHVEIQVLADNHGNVVYLFERECSIQRRHQKVIEEAPSAIVTPDLRKRMGEAAVNVCKAANYNNAGTVEFLVDDKRNFYFLEMNTRIQVEHPVTEMITGIDIVEQQIKIAQNEPLSFTQEDLYIRGHALEVRVYAEDSANNFMPDIGKLTVYRPPQGEGIRVDDGFEEGMNIPIYYDPMLAKLIVHAPNRQAAIAKMIQAIDNYDIVGVETTLDFCRFVLNHEAFTSGDFDTHFVPKYFSPEKLRQKLTADEETIAAITTMLIKEEEEAKQSYVVPKRNEKIETEISVWRNIRSH